MCFSKDKFSAKILDKISICMLITLVLKSPTNIRVARVVSRFLVQIYA